MMELLCKNSWRFLALSYFRKKLHDDVPQGRKYTLEQNTLHSFTTLLGINSLNNQLTGFFVKATLGFNELN